MCSIICLIAVTSITHADEKLDTKVELVYENFTQKVKLDKAEVLLKEKIGHWLNEKTINSFDGEESFSRTYLKFSHKRKKATIYGIVGISRMTSTVNELPELTRESSVEGFGWKTKENGLLLRGKSDLGFLAGVGVDFTFRQKNNVELRINAQYLLQKERGNNIVLFDELTLDHGDVAYSEWHETIEVQKTRNREFTTAFSLSKKAGKWTFSVGSLFMITKTSYLGESVVRNQYVRLDAVYYYKKESRNEFIFKSTSRKNLSALMEAAYEPDKKTKIFAELIVGARNSLSVGITF